MVTNQGGPLVNWGMSPLIYIFGLLSVLMKDKRESMNKNREFFVKLGISVSIYLAWCLYDEEKITLHRPEQPIV